MAWAHRGETRDPGSSRCPLHCAHCLVVKAVSQSLWSVKVREEWFSLGENHEKPFGFGLHQLRNRYSDRAIPVNVFRERDPSMKIKEQTIPFHVASVGEDEASAAADVIRSGWLTMGPKTIEFERNFASYVGAKHAIGVSSCTAALHLALEAVGLQQGDEVLVPTTTFTATAEVVVYFKAIPVLVDVDPVTLCIDPEEAQKKITSRTRAILPVHFAGQPCDMDRIQELAASHSLHVIEDAAHSLPASFRGTPSGPSAS
jgi:cystathionine beta-lyase/cystathionine gamma-synthase